MPNFKKKPKLIVNNNILIMLYCLNLLNSIQQYKEQEELKKNKQEYLELIYL